MPTDQNSQNENNASNKSENVNQSAEHKTPEQSEAAYKNWNTRQALDTNNLGSTFNSNDVANNDGSTFETLDTAFHEKPGYHEGPTVAGSNRADYYESRENGKSDVEEELEVLKRKNQL